MSISTTAKELLFSADMWSQSVADAVSQLREGSPTASKRHWAIELAMLSELCCLDRSYAITASLWAYRADQSKFSNLEKAHRLSCELGDPTSRAKIAKLITDTTGSPDAALAEGYAWLDVGDYDKAVKPLLSAKRKYQDNPLLNLSLQVAQCEWTNVREQIGLFQESTDSSDDKEKSASYMASFWLAKQLKEPVEKCGTILLKAHQSNPSEITLRALEAYYGQFDAQKLVPVFESLAVDSPPDIAYRLRWRCAAKLFCTHSSQGAAFELGMRTLKEAYHADVTYMPGHLALVEKLVTSSIELRREDEILDLLQIALGGSPSTLEISYMCVLGDKISTDESDIYRQILASVMPDHPLAKDVEPLPIDEVTFLQLDENDSDYDAVSIDEVSSQESEKIDVHPAQPAAAPPPIPPKKSERSATLNTTADDSADKHKAALPELTQLPTDPAATETTVASGSIPSKGSSRIKKRSEMDRLNDGWDFSEMDIGAKASVTEVFTEKAQQPLATEDSVQSVSTPTPSKPKISMSLIPKAAMSALQQKQSSRDELRNTLAAVGAKRSQRINRALDVVISLNNQEYTCVLRDVSATGVFLVSDKVFKDNSELLASVALTSKSSTENVKLKLKIVRKSGNGYGCLIINPPQAYLNFFKTMES